MKVLLVIPVYRYKYVYPSFFSNTDFPVGFAYLASSLSKAGHEVSGLNPNNIPGYSSAYEMLKCKLEETLNEIKPQFIGIGGLCTDFNFLKDCIYIIRKIDDSIPIVCGGGIITHDTDFIFKTLKPDYCIIGEGEDAIVSLTNAIENGKTNLDEILNIGYWKNGEAKYTRRDYNYHDINLLPLPDYEPFNINDMLDKYSLASRSLYRFTRSNPRPMTIVTARGCPFSCTFCVHHNGIKYRARSVDNIIHEIEEIYNKYEFNILIIFDELFAVNKQKMTEFCDALIAAKKNRGWDFDWLFQTHASAALDANTLQHAKNAGCYLVSYGVESASQDVLESMNKKTKPSQILNGIKAAEEAGIGFAGNFIFGDPAETVDTISESFVFFNNHCRDMFVYLSFIQLYPGSVLFDNALKNRLIKDKYEFYETIDEKVWNLTKIPDEIWVPWISIVYFLSLTFPWAKTTKAIEIVQETESNELFVKYTKQKIINISAECPHCKNKIIIRDVVAINCKNNVFINIFKQIYNLFMQKLGRLYVMHAIKNMILFLFHFTNPLYDSLKILYDHDVSSVKIITGCPKCKKRIRVCIANSGLFDKLLFVIKNMIAGYPSKVKNKGRGLLI